MSGSSRWRSGCASERKREARVGCRREHDEHKIRRTNPAARLTRYENAPNEPNRAGEPWRNPTNEPKLAHPPIAQIRRTNPAPGPANPKSDERTQLRRPTNAKRTQPRGPADTNMGETNLQPRWWVIAKSTERTQDRRSDDHEIRRTNPRPADPQQKPPNEPKTGRRQVQDFPTMPTRSEPGVARNSWNEAKIRQYKKSLTNLSDGWIEPGNWMMGWICLDEIESPCPHVRCRLAGERHPRIRVRHPCNLTQRHTRRIVPRPLG